MKKDYFKITSLWLLFILIGKLTISQDNAHFHNHENHSNADHFLFKENKGQWHPNSLFKTILADGSLFLENDGLTYSFIDKSFIRSLHSENKPKEFPKSFKAHGIKVKFKNSNKDVLVSKKEASSFYENYFIGNDSTKWASNVRAFHEVYYTNIYNNIDFSIYSEHSNLKYDFIVHPNGNTKNIQVEYTGAKNMYIKEGILYVKTSITDIIEQKPYAYQIINNEKVRVPCNYKLNNNRLSFDFPLGYNKEETLIIDPVLVFSSYSGSSADNFGFTATYDNNGFTYAGGISFGVGYPVTTGAYNTSYTNGGTNSFFVPHTDISISKFNANGSALLYSTYLGGSTSEAPHSLVTNNAGELFILGTTGSNNFPVTAGTYDNSFNGGSYSFPGGSGMEHNNGSDIYVAKLSPNGSSLLASTYIGGAGNDGLNTVAGLDYNYGDPFRGEIIIDNGGNCIVTSTTNSIDFPTAGGGSAYMGGSSDGVIFKFNPSLTSLLWSTHVGGTGDDSGYGIQLDAIGNLFVTGGTSSGDLTNALNSYGGLIDGYLQKYSTAGTLLASRYIGTSSYDQSYLVQVDINDDVYIVGQSEGSMPVSIGKYSNPNSGQFIQKFNNSLSTLQYGTVIGRGTGGIDISPSAFLVNDCGLIYLSGWGGASNGSVPSSTTNGLPITSNAYQSTTDGSDFYLMVLDRDATGLLYGTFFGGGTSHEHVDGGTSRFDKDGNIYQAVCAGCGGNSDFPTTPTAWSRTNNSGSCNLGVFKFNVDVVYAIASVPQATICFPAPVNFVNNSNGGNTYLWDFGDGTNSSQFAPSHIYNGAGTYNVSLIVSDSNGCVIPDTSIIAIQVVNPAQAAITPDTSICPNTSLQLNSGGGTNYLWSPSVTLSNVNIANPIANPTTNTTYQVIVSSICGNDTAFVDVEIFTVTSSSSNDTIICLGDSIQIMASGGDSYNWTPATNISNTNVFNPIVYPSISSTYNASIITPDGCPASESVFIEVEQGLPNPVITNDTGMCFGEIMPLAVSGARSYLWYPNYNLSSITATNIFASPTVNTTYYVDFTNICGTVTDSISIILQKPTALVSPDDTACFNDTSLLWASGGVNYLWSPSNNLATPNNDSTLFYPDKAKSYQVIVTDILGCRDTAITTIYFSPIPSVDAGNNKTITFGEEVILSPSHSDGSFSWINNSSLSCFNCENPIANPNSSTTYTAYLLDTYGCEVTDNVTIYVDGTIYVPNAFTPNNDDLNDIFYVKGKDIIEYELFIFNRWGKLLFTSQDMNEGWNGTFRNKNCKTDVYVWRLVYSDVNTFNKEHIGHVSLLR
jgi:gliding motility-associated-like protein